MSKVQSDTTLENLIKEYEVQWQAGLSPDIAEFLSRYKSDPLELLRELVHVDMEFRFSQRERIRAHDYFVRFPLLANNQDLSVELIKTEFRFLERIGESVNWSSFKENYPDHQNYLGDDLASTIVFHSASKSPELPKNYIPTIPEFIIEEEIGRGGMGIVYRAFNQELNRMVAIKTLRSGSMATAGERERFQREAEAIALLDHPNIVPIYKVGRWKLPDSDVEIPYFVMKYYPGGSLDGLKSQAPLDFRQICEMMETISHSIHHAHQRGILHRDLKPSNILMDEASQPNVADLGLASKVDAPAKTLSLQSIVGTPAYMAPEQATNPNQVTTSADVYGLGAILYQLLTGQPPFSNESSFNLLKAMIESAPLRPRKHRPSIPFDLETICLKCLEKSPQRRYGSALELAEDLRRWRTGYPIIARPVTPIEHGYRLIKRHPFFTGMLVFTLVALSFGVISLAISNDAIRDQERRTALAFNGAKELNNELMQSLDREQKLLYIEQVSSAARLWESNQVSQAWELLNLCPPNQRGWEWNYLNRIRLSAPLRLSGHNDRIQTCLFLDSKRLVSADTRGSICIWDLDKQKKQIQWLVKPVNQAGPVTGLASNPGNSWLASVNMERIILWNFSTQERLRELKGQRWVCCSPDGRFLASAFGNDIHVWDCLTWKLLWTLRGHEKPAIHGVFSPDSSTLLTSSTDLTIRHWKMSTGKQTHYWQRPIPVNAFIFAEHGRVVIEAYQGAILISEFPGGHTVRRIEQAGLARPSIALHPDGKRFATATTNSEIVIYSLNDNSESRTLRGHALAISSLAFSPDGVHLASVGADKPVHLWNLENDFDIQVLLNLEPESNRIVLSPNGKYLCILRQAVESTPQPLKLLDSQTGNVVLEAQGMHDVVFTEDGQQLLTGSPHGVVLLSVHNGKMTREWNIPDFHLRSLARTVESNRFALGSTQGSIYVLDPTNDKLLQSFFPGLGSINSLAFHPDGKRLAINGSNQCAIWDLRTNQLHHKFVPSHGSYKIAFDPKGNWLATLDADRTIRLFDTDSYQLLRPIASSATRISDFAVHPSGTRLATRSVDGMIRLWHLESGRDLLSLHGNELPFGSILWDSGGDKLISVDRKLRIWSAIP